MSTRGTQYQEIRDNQDKILVLQRGAFHRERQPPTSVSCKQKSQFDGGDAERATEHRRGPAWLESETASWTGTTREAAVTVAKRKGVIKVTEPQSPSLYLLCPRIPWSTTKRKGGASSDLTRPNCTVSGGDLAGGVVTAVSPAPRTLLLQTWHSTNTC